MPGFGTKAWNGLLRQFALSGSGAGLAPEKNINIEMTDYGAKKKCQQLRWHFLEYILSFKL